MALSCFLRPRVLVPKRMKHLRYTVGGGGDYLSHVLYGADQVLGSMGRGTEAGVKIRRNLCLKLKISGKPLMGRKS